MVGGKAKKILYLHRTQGVGVEAVHINGISDAFRELDYEVDIFSPTGMKHETMLDIAQAELSQSAKTEKSSLISKHMPEFLFELLEIVYNVFAMVKLFTNGVAKYDIVFERYAIFSVIGAIVSKLRNIPFVLEVNYTTNSPLVRKRTALLKPLARLVDKFVFRSATLLTPVSTTLERELIEQYGIPAEKIIVLPNAADPQKFKPADRRALADAPHKVIGFVGGFYPWHGLDLLLEAFYEIQYKVPEAKLMLIGDGPELDAIKRKAKEIGVLDKVEFPGRIDHSSLPEFMQRFYVGVMPNSNDYGSPMKIFEYMALSVPVVAPNYPPILDVLEDGKQGVLFERCKSEALSAALEKVLLAPGFASVLSSNARKSVENVHNWNENVKKIVSFLGRQEIGRA